MKIEQNKKYTTVAVYAVIVFAICLLMVIAVFKFDGLKTILSNIIKVLSPIIWGMAIAYLLNPVMKFFERHIKKVTEKNKPRKKMTRVISLTFTILLAIIAIAASISIVIPQLTKSVTTLYLNLDTYFINIRNSVNGLLDKYPEINSMFPQISDMINEETIGIQDWLMDLLSSPELKKFFSTMTLGAYNAVIGVKDFLLGFIVSVYLLASKEIFAAQAKKIMYALFPKRFCTNALYISHKADNTFISFITGKALDSFIIGMICFVGITIMGTQNEVLISFIIGVTNMIPFFGPFIGAIPCALFILLTNPSKIILFIIFVIILQQFDGNILGPKILGDSTGLPAFWVMFAIFIGGGLFGFIGMLIGVPVFAVIYMLIKQFVKSRLQKKSLPLSTESYKQNKIIREVNYVFEGEVAGQLSIIPNSTVTDTDTETEDNDSYISEMQEDKKQKIKVSDILQKLHIKKKR